MEGAENGIKRSKRPSSIDWKRHSGTTGLVTPIYLMARQARVKKRQPPILRSFCFARVPKMLFHVKHVMPADGLHQATTRMLRGLNLTDRTLKKSRCLRLIMKMTRKGYEPGRKIYIISRADRMNVAAANTLLKFLEEPEGEVTAILLTDSYQSILPTIQSRCQRSQLFFHHVGKR